MRVAAILLGLVALGVGLSKTAPADDVNLALAWYGDDAVQWTRHGAEIFAVGDRLVVLDAVTGAERRWLQLQRPRGQIELLPQPATDGRLILFGWYLWDRKEAVIVSYDVQTLTLQWQRRIAWGEGAHSIGPRIDAAFEDSAVYVQLTGRQDEEHLLKLRRDTGDVIWAQQFDRWMTGVPPVWYQGKLLIRSAVEFRYPDGHGHYQLVNPINGLPVWRIRLESMPVVGYEDVPVIDGDWAYLTANMPGPYKRFYVVDLQRGRLAENTITDELRPPFAYLNRVMYFAGQRPAAQYVRYRPDAILWRTTITPSDGLLPGITNTGVVDEVNKRIYLGDTLRGVWVLSMTDGKLLGLIDTRPGAASRRPFASRGARRLERDGDRMLVGTQDGRLLVYRLARP
ncbi:MAG: hypothetical protein A3I14_01205 [Candidatus Rokubacteria bacterium RIFCSPLOWO2_02_FULL_73_56]|nr:MAG: hypothetical protein A3D33_14010 [Candidatus Rokubacteria bacterium RIFCSPHIGHO2_02_FULL_73_26]OGL10842.1 MAG: hypothetical protein A3I14_01205 [Candidatus Rokubacteria bacterium RIFCSPLOWO2_02_FULL_73_56]OGL26171.1 MAG: hypothetical protein A3G44_17520 [Candidatus Rokubacteria bacterium RIFCSPLOWO2_12_FULL_73_47]